MKCTIRKVPDGIIATVDETIKEGDIFMHPNLTIERASRDLDGRGLYKIIASTFGVGKELQFDFSNKSYIFGHPSDDIINGEEYEYTQTETQVIIQL